MSLFRRISATVSATLDNVVSRVEDHDAVIAASLTEGRQAAARTRVRLNRVRRDIGAIEENIEKLKGDAGRWEQRARGLAGNDEERALACIKRRRQCQRDIENLETSLVQHRDAERKIAANLDDIERRVGEFSQRRNVMRSRQSVADAMRVIDRLEGQTGLTVEESFDRWEERLIESEIGRPPATGADAFESEFVMAEEAESLKLELDSLVREKREGDDERA